MSASPNTFAVAFAFVAATACSSSQPSAAGSGASGGDPDSGASIASRVLAAEVAAYTNLCKCPAALGQPDSTTCFTHFVARTPPEADCVRALFEARATELDTILECEIQVAANVQACLAKIANCEPGPVLACATSGQTANMACGAYPDAVQRGINECYGMEDAGGP